MSGLDFIGSPKNPYLYQGKEFFEEHDFDLHYFGARMFDSELGRWHSCDPELVYASPYNGMGNNPISFIDPTGRNPEGVIYGPFGPPLGPFDLPEIGVYGIGRGPLKSRGGDFNVATTGYPGIISGGGGTPSTAGSGLWDSPSGLPPAGSGLETGNGIENNSEGRTGGSAGSGSLVLLGKGNSNEYKGGGRSTKDMAAYHRMASQSSKYNSLTSDTNGWGGN